MAKNNKYSKPKASDFYDYFDGKMSQEDRHAFELQLQKDLFNEEAAEGFEMITREDARKDLDSLNGIIKRRTSKNRRIVWYSAAAAVASILVVASIFFNLNDTKMDRLSTMPELREAAKEKSAPLRKEKGGLEEIQAEENLKPDNINNRIEPGISNAASNEGSGNNTNSQSEEIPEPDTDEILVMGEGDQDMFNEVETSDLQDDENVTAEMSLPKSDAPVNFSEKPVDKQEAVADVVPGTDKIAAYAAPDAEFAAQTVGAEKKRSEVSSRMASGVSEEEIAAIIEDNSELAAAPVAIVNSSLTNTSYEPAAPEGGVTEYRRYLDSTLVFPKENIEMKAGTALLRFSITTSGRPTKFQVIQATSTAFSKEATRVIQNGPDWLPAKRDGIIIEDSVELKIEFGEEQKR